jgi:hypothetical protein
VTFQWEKKPERPRDEREEAATRASDAWNQRYKHGKAARTWDAIAVEEPRRRRVSEILARWMAAYEAADAEAEKALSELAAAPTDSSTT